MKKAILVLTLIALFFLVAAGQVIPAAYSYEPDKNETEIQKPSTEESTKNPGNSEENKIEDDISEKLVMKEDKIRNILILGLDARRNERARTDVMMLVNIKGDRINIISIPRDTLVDLGSRGVHKINAAYAFGGIDLSRKTVESLFDTKIDNYIVFNFRAVEKSVDAIGGFEVNIPKNIAIRDPEYKRYYTINKGQQKLNGHQTISYLRYRSDGMGDIGRIGRQQEFLKDLQKNFLKIENIPLIPRVYFAVKNEVKTDMRPVDMADCFAKGYELRSSIQYYMLRGRCKMIDEVSYYIKDKESLEILKKVIK